jgi:hypothetical protein
MPKPAVAVASAGGASGRAQTAPDTELNARLTTLGRQIGYGRGLRPGRTQLLALGILIVAFWLVVVFGRALGQLNDATLRQEAASAATATLQAQLEAGRRELVLVQTDAFQRLQARSLGMGERGELVFTLNSEGPPPRIVPLGQRDATSATQGPLEAWLELLFGR